MGFFKNLGKSLKNVTKMVSLKNVMKVASGEPVNFGKELAQRVLAPHIKTSKPKVEQFQDYQQPQIKLSKPIANLQNTVDNAVVDIAMRQNPNLMDILQQAGAGALQGAGTALAGGKTTANAGAELVDNTMNAWFKKNWLKALAGLVLVVGTILLIVRMSKPKSKYGYKR